MIFLASILVGGIIGFLVINFMSGFLSAMKDDRSSKKTQHIQGSPQGVRAKAQGTSPSPANVWWGNLQHTPLSDTEAQRIATQVAQFYNSWQADYSVEHSWLCIALNADKVECRQIYRDFSRGTAPTPTFPYSHRLSCQADREHLAQHILHRILRDHPYCKLYLDGDSLILPTNL